MINKVITGYIIILVLSFGKCPADSKKEMLAFDISYHVPIINSDSSLFDLLNHYQVIYYKGMVMYRVYYLFDSTVDGKRLLETIRDYYVVSQKDSSYGYAYYHYDPHTMPKGRISIDSITSKIRYESAGYDSLLFLKPDSINVNSDGSLLKIYTRLPDIQFPERYTFYLYYKKGLDILKEKFAGKIDRFNNMKLYKLKVVAHGAYWEQYKQTLPERELLLEMKEIPIENPDEVLRYFKDYQQRITKK